MLSMYVSLVASLVPAPPSPLIRPLTYVNHVMPRYRVQARTSFEPALDSLRVRTVHVMKRLFEVVEHMLLSDGMQMSDTHQKPFGELEGVDVGVGVSVGVGVGVGVCWYCCGTK